MTLIRTGFLLVAGYAVVSWQIVGWVPAGCSLALPVAAWCALLAAGVTGVPLLPAVVMAAVAGLMQDIAGSHRLGAHLAMSVLAVRLSADWVGRVPTWRVGVLAAGLAAASAAIRIMPTTARELSQLHSHAWWSEAARVGDAMWLAAALACSWVVLQGVFQRLRRQPSVASGLQISNRWFMLTE
jgi:hypothetical protein